MSPDQIFRLFFHEYSKEMNDYTRCSIYQRVYWTTKGSWELLRTAGDLTKNLPRSRTFDLGYVGVELALAAHVLDPAGREALVAVLGVPLGRLLGQGTGRVRGRAAAQVLVGGEAREGRRGGRAGFGRLALVGRVKGLLLAGCPTDALGLPADAQARAKCFGGQVFYEVAASFFGFFFGRWVVVGFD